MKIDVKTYGLHLTIDGYGANKKRLDDITFLFETLNKLPEMIGMNKIGFPHIIQFTEGDIRGISGFIFIIESHISIHTYSKKRFFSMDVYSCKKFDHKKVVNIIKKLYKIKEIEVNVIELGKSFPA